MSFHAVLTGSVQSVPVPDVNGHVMPNRLIESAASISARSAIELVVHAQPWDAQAASQVAFWAPRKYAYDGM